MDGENGFIAPASSSSDASRQHGFFRDPIALRLHLINFTFLL